MRWDHIKVEAARAACDQIESVIIMGKGEAHVAAAAMLRDLYDGHDIPENIKAFMDSGWPIGQAIIKAAKDAAIATIDAWDIRAIGRLRKLFPMAFPKQMLTGMLYCEYDDKGRWCVYPQ